MNRYEKVIHKKVFNFEDICELTGNVNTAKSLIKKENSKDSDLKDILINISVTKEILEYQI